MLWWVINGLALAPPAIVFKIGVSTSKKPLSSKNDLNALRAFVLIKKAFLTSGLTIKSTYLCLYLKSWSFNPWYFSGNIWRDLVNKTTLLAFTDISSFLVLNTSPSRPIMSPISYVENIEYSSSPILSNLT